MSLAILDTSLLITLAFAEREKAIAIDNNSTYWQQHNAIDSAIEALILYDQIFIDKPSVHRNAERFPELLEYGEICSFLDYEDRTEDEIYRAIFDKYVPQLKSKQSKLSNLFTQILHQKKLIRAEIAEAVV